MISDYEIEFGMSDEDEFDPDAPMCNGCIDGVKVVCIDDLCRGMGYCIHGEDGEEICPLHGD